MTALQVDDDPYESYEVIIDPIDPIDPCGRRGTVICDDDGNGDVRPDTHPGLYQPFEPRINPHAEAVNEQTVEWASALGMLSTEQHVRDAWSQRLGLLAARAFPYAAESELRLISDWTAVFCLLDDRIESMDWREATMYLLEVLTTFEGGDPSESLAYDPFIFAMTDIRQRLLEATGPADGMEWIIEEMGRLLTANIIEVQRLRSNHPPTLPSYLSLRETTIGLGVMFALADAITTGRRMTLAERRHPVIMALMSMTAGVIGLANDIFTHEKESSSAVITHNVVSLLMGEHSIPVEQAVAYAGMMHDAAVHLIEEEISLAQLNPPLDLPNDVLDAVIDRTMCWISGHMEWAHETGRYRAKHHDSECHSPRCTTSNEEEWTEFSNETTPPQSPNALLRRHVTTTH